MKNAYLTRKRDTVLEKFRETGLSVLPFLAIVFLICLFLVPVASGLMLAFVLGAFCILLGLSLFNIGVEASMIPIGTLTASALTRSKKLPLILLVSFLLGTAITVAEPDLQVLAETVPTVDTTVLILTVGVGVGFFLMLAMLRILFGVNFRLLFFIFYGLLFLLAAFCDAGFLPVAFDAGGVTTGPMTVPFILALGVGIANIRSDKKALSDSFGLVALCSIGPILAVLVLSFFYRAEGTYTPAPVTEWSTTAEIGAAYLAALPRYLAETAKALLPVAAIFLLFQVFSFRLSPRPFLKILSGILHAYVGLVLFLVGVNVGFSSLGSVLGSLLSHEGTKFLLVPIAAILGWFIISAEPAVYVLEKQIEQVSEGAIPGRAIKYSLAAAVAVAMGLSMLRVILGFPIIWILVPGYAAALILSFFVPEIYTALAFDSGGVASGPMTATFMLQFMIGACTALGGNVLESAFGVVALVAMFPLLSIQIVGVLFGRRKPEPSAAEIYGDTEIIELWEG